MEKLAGKLSDHLIVKGVVEAEDRDIYIFGLECLLGSVVQTTVSLVLALLTGVLPQTIACIITFGSLKKWAGGFHAGTHLSCIGTLNSNNAHFELCRQTDSDAMGFTGVTGVTFSCYSARDPPCPYCTSLQS